MPSGHDRLPILALVGRPNVGKSTLFNALTRSRDALVADRPGLTRDRIYGYGQRGDRPFLVVDTGGLAQSGEEIAGFVARQTDTAIAEADAVLFMLDARSGLTADDRAIAERLRRSGKPVHVVVNKGEGLDEDIATAEFFALGLGRPFLISAAHGDGVAETVEAILEKVPASEGGAAPKAQGMRVAVVGKPNVGKSTLVNRLLGEERVLALDAPGTTRDSIEAPFERDGEPYVLIDTAGIRRRARVEDHIEKISVIKSLQAIEQADVVIAMLDARQGVGVHDAHLLGLIAQRGRAMVIAVNKWDRLEADKRREIERDIDRKLPFLDYAPLHYISALHGSGLGELFDSIHVAYDASLAELPTPELTRALEEAVEANAPPAVVGRRIKLRYAHQGGRNPPTIVIHGNQTEHLPVSYRRYLVHRFRKAFKLVGTPVQLVFRTGENPFEGRTRTKARKGGLPKRQKNPKRAKRRAKNR